MRLPLYTSPSVVRRRLASYGRLCHKAERGSLRQSDVFFRKPHRRRHCDPKPLSHGLLSQKLPKNLAASKVQASIFVVSVRAAPKHLIGMERARKESWSKAPRASLPTSASSAAIRSASRSMRTATPVSTSLSVSAQRMIRAGAGRQPHPAERFASRWHRTCSIVIRGVSELRDKAPCYLVLS
jgi:hypothetical protein